MHNYLCDRCLDTGTVFFGRRCPKCKGDPKSLMPPKPPPPAAPPPTVDSIDKGFGGERHVGPCIGCGETAELNLPHPKGICRACVASGVSFQFVVDMKAVHVYRARWNLTWWLGFIGGTVITTMVIGLGFYLDDPASLYTAFFATPIIACGGALLEVFKVRSAFRKG